MSPQRLPFVACLTFASITSSVSAQTWDNAAGGDWSLAANWAPMSVPMVAGDDALLGGLGGPYIVDLDISVQIDSLMITDADARLELETLTLEVLDAGGLINAGTIVANSSTSHHIIGDFTNNNAVIINPGRGLYLDGPVINNNGTITVNPVNSSSDGFLRFASNVTVGGTGTIDLFGSGNNSQILTDAGITFTNGASHTITGNGQIPGSMINDGLTTTGPSGMTFITTAKTNNGTMSATQGSLSINSITIDQTGGGTLLADGGDVRLASVTVDGGELDSTGGSVVRTVSGTTALLGVANRGALNIDQGTVAGVTGNLVNSGLITLNPINSASDAFLRFDTSGNLVGNGELVLFGAGGNSQLLTAVGATITQGASHIISGRGNVLASLVNNGIVDSNIPAGTLLLTSSDKTNNNLMRASNGGILLVSGITIDQDPGASIDADDATVNLQSSTINGGTLNATGTGVMRGTSGSNLFDSVTNNAPFDVNPGTVMRVIGTGLNNNALLTVNPINSASDAFLIFDASGTLGGTGEVVLFGAGGNSQLGSNGSTITHTATHTISGRGTITAPLVNEGVIRSDQGATLTLSASPKTNNNLIAATGGSNLLINSIAVTQGPGASILADDSTVQLAGCTIDGGTLDAAAAGSMAVTSGNVTLINVMNAAPIAVNPGTVLNVNGVGLTNENTITVNPINSSSDAFLRFNETGTLDGSGTVILEGAGGNSQFIGLDGTVTVTLGSSQTVRGRGTISAGILNEGLVQADTGGTLTLSGNPKTNNADIVAPAGSFVDISGITMTQTGPGQIHADEGTVRFVASTVTGGTLNATGAGFGEVASGTCFFDNVVSNMPIIVDPGRIMRLSNGVTNNALISVNPINSSSDGFIILQDATPVTGSGTIQLTGLGANSQMQSNGGTGTIGAGQTVAGGGLINGTFVLNGTTSPGLSVGTLSTAGTITFGATHTLDIEVSGPSSADSLSGSAAMNLGGTLDVTLIDGFEPTGCVTYEIISGVSVTGAFDTVNFPAFTLGDLEWRVVYDTNSVTIALACPADANADCIINTNDFIKYLNLFNAGDPAADLAFPFGTINTSDFIAFLNIFNASCTF